MTIAFICDRCGEEMDRESDRYYIRGHISEDQLDLCPKCLTVVKVFMAERLEKHEEEQDTDTSLRHKKVYRK